MATRASAVAAIALVALCASPASAARNTTIVSNFVSVFELTSTPTTTVPSGDRVSADQQFAKTWTIREDSATALSAFMIDLPGRVFFSLASSSLGDRVAARIKVSGETTALVDSVQVTFTESRPVTPGEVVSIQREVMNRQRGPLLVEVELARRNSLRTLLGMGNGDLVLLANVLYSSEHDPFFNASVILDSVTTTTLSPGSGRLFVADKTASVTTATVILNGQEGAIQLELAAIKTTNTVAASTNSVGNVTLFVDDLGAKVKVQLGRKRSTGYVCIADVSASSNTNFAVDGDAARVSYPGQPSRPFPCTKLAVPERVPADTEAADSAKSGGVALAELGIAAYAVTGLASLLLAAASAL